MANTEQKKILPDIAQDLRTPAVDLLYSISDRLLEENWQLKLEIVSLKSEIARLKNRPDRPKIKASKMDDDDPNSGKGDNTPKRKAEPKEKQEKEITETKIIKVKDIPEGATFKGYKDYDVQELEIKAKNIRYQLECWQLSNGTCITAELPESVKGYHFGSVLRSYILYQYHAQSVTQPLILEGLREVGISISVGEIDRILNDDKEAFHKENNEVLQAGLKDSKYIQTDDTGARHEGKNGYCTCIGNAFFTYFASRKSKSRINFLGLLRAGYEDYILNDEAIRYMQEQRLAKEILNKMLYSEKHWENQESWEKYLEEIDVKDKRYKQIATEGVLLGSVIGHGFLKDSSVLSDDAGQFNILSHALCWIHAERTITKLIPHNDLQEKIAEEVLSEFWLIYKKLKKYKTNPTEEGKKAIEDDFDALFSKRTDWVTVNSALKRLRKNKKELLLVLERPEIPLHNNQSENDIRGYVKKRKISGSTRSDNGKNGRDTFAGLRKTCKKLKISYWRYLNDRFSKANSIPKLSTLVAEAIRVAG